MASLREILKQAVADRADRAVESGDDAVPSAADAESLGAHLQIPEEPLPSWSRMIQIAGFEQKYLGVDPAWEFADGRATLEFDRYCENLADQVHSGSWLYLLGPVGVGKTSAMARLVGKLPLSWCPLPAGHVAPEMVRYRLATDFADDLIEWDQADKQRGMPPDMTLNMRARVLLIDDLDRMLAIGGYQRDIVLSRWDTFAEQRDGRWLTVVTANLSEAELREHPGFARGIDRARGRGTIISIPGESMRTGE